MVKQQGITAESGMYRWDDDDVGRRRVGEGLARRRRRQRFG